MKTALSLDPTEATMGTAGLARAGRERMASARKQRRAVRLLDEVAAIDASQARYILTPQNDWHSFVKRMGGGCAAMLRWKEQDETIPLPPHPHECWLLPTEDEAAARIAKLREPLVREGWKVLTAPEHVVQQLSNKARFREFAEARGLLAFLPTHYTSADAAVYPCVLKAAEGAYGQGTSIVQSKAAVLASTAGAAATGNEWLLQELVRGKLEYATSLLCRDGTLLDAITTRYEYAADEYVWPDVKEIRTRRTSSRDIIQSHKAVMASFLDGYDGFCNFNYKLREDGTPCIFEVNTRIGADLACDVPASWLRAFFQKLDT
uniref:ATP-grasp domain-containing protein n=1 Tax=Haptolina ericina TaxID=156174 RepID=A0A7S3BF86_9EUKA|mmetsp:Transcript_5851/g.12784  ORF Transcript_5851/g.12784 Transcript_5851/m.12784 type:complete len:320 (+) Transcript_5851:676-1635(+)